jgi:hypothetical protein
MIDSLEITNFRCFPDLRISSLGRVNLIAGVNNVGKTALLEAVYLLAAPDLPIWPPPMNFLRGFDKLPTSVDLSTRWGWLFHERDVRQPVSIGWQAGNGNERSVRVRWLSTGEIETIPLGDALETPSEKDGPDLVSLDFTEPGRTVHCTRVFRNKLTRATGRVPSIPVGVISGAKERGLEEDARRLSEMYLTGGVEHVIGALRVLEPRLSDLRVLNLGGISMLYGEIGIGRPVPLSQMGEGVGRILSLVLEITQAAGGIVLIDEVEHGLHHSVMGKIWRLIDEAAKRSDVQVFATTHSWECIQAAHMAFDQDPTYDLRLYRLERAGDDIKVIQYDRETLGTSVDMNLEVR